MWTKRTSCAMSGCPILHQSWRICTSMMENIYIFFSIHTPALRMLWYVVLVVIPLLHSSFSSFVASIRVCFCWSIFVHSRIWSKWCHYLRPGADIILYMYNRILKIIVMEHNATIQFTHNIGSAPATSPSHQMDNAQPIIIYVNWYKISANWLESITLA